MGLFDFITRKNGVDYEAATSIEFIVQGGAKWTPTPELIEAWHTAYPQVDIVSELNKAAAWCLSNEPKRKKKRGMPRFINNWLSKCEKPRQAWRDI